MKRYEKYLNLSCMSADSFHPSGIDLSLGLLSVKVNRRNCMKAEKRLGFYPEGRGFTRSAVRRRDNFTCQDCGNKRTPKYIKEYNSQFTSLKGRKKLHDVHHKNGLCGKKSKSYDRIEDIDTLITLCHKCHFNRPEHKSKKIVEVINSL